MGIATKKVYPFEKQSQKSKSEQFTRSKGKKVNIGKSCKESSGKDMGNPLRGPCGKGLLLLFPIR